MCPRSEWIGIDRRLLLTAATARDDSIVVLITADLPLAIPTDVAASAGRIGGRVAVVLAAIQIEGDSEHEEEQKRRQLEKFFQAQSSDLHRSLHSANS